LKNGRDARRKKPINPYEIRFSIKRLKTFARKQLPKNSPLRLALENEKNSISGSELLAKAPIWLTLIENEKK